VSAIPSWTKFFQPSRFFSAAGVLFALVGCAPERAADLVELHEVSSQAVESRSELELRGADFPAGREADVTFRGVLYAPGAEPRRVSWSLRPRAESSTRIPLGIGSPELAAWLAGSPHGTFRGEILVEFRPLRAGGPTLLGRLGDQELDVFGAPSGGSARDADAFEHFLQVDLDSQFRVLEVGVGGPGEAAGLLVGDRVVALDGVHLVRSDDLVPRPRGDTAELRVERPGTLDSAILVADKTGFESSSSPSGYAASLILLGGLLALLVIARPPALLRWLSFQNAIEARPRGRASTWIQPGTLTGLTLALGLLMWTSRESWPKGLPHGSTLLLALAVVLAVGAALEKAVRLGQLLLLMPLVFGGLAGGFESGDWGLWSHPLSLHSPLLLSSPWFLLLGLGAWVALLGLGRSQDQNKSTVLADVILGVLTVLWVSTFLAPAASWPTVVKAVYTAWAAVLQSVLVAWFRRSMPDPGFHSLVVRLALGLMVFGLAFYALTFRFDVLRRLPGLEQATLTFFVVLAGAGAWAIFRVFTRQARLVDPWV
jgi:hypothetical protein